MPFDPGARSEYPRNPADPLPPTGHTLSDPDAGPRPPPTAPSVPAPVPSRPPGTFSDPDGVGGGPDRA